jgi:hypothetical protein
MEVKMSLTNTQKQVPSDILQIHSFLQDFRADLTDVIMMAVDEWSAALRDDIRAWQESNGPEPGWQSFREWLNEICQEGATPAVFLGGATPAVFLGGAMPLLFPKLPPEAIPDEKTESPVESGLASGDLAGFVAGKGDAYDYLPDWMQLPPLYHNENHPNPLAIIKLFTPDSSWTWFLMESDGNGLLFGLVAGLETEFGYVRLAELKSVTGPMGLHIERDLWFRPTPVRELPEYRERWGSDGPYPGGTTTPDLPADTTPPPKRNICASASQSYRCAAPSQELPAGWTNTDIRFLLEILEESPILVADHKLGIPTIHDNFGAHTRHLGFGFMQVDGDGYTLRFDAGGAMQRTPSGNGWTKLSVEGQYDRYDLDAVRQTLRSWLPPENEAE